MKVNFIDLKKDYKKNESIFFKAIKQVGKRGDFILGKSLINFEKAVCKYLKVKYCIGVGNGTDALILSLKSIGIERGDEVIVPVNSFVASAAAVVECGAVPIFVDICACLNLDLLAVEKKITKKTKAIMPVHYAGQVVNHMKYLIKIAKKNKIAIIEDAAQSFGAKLDKKFAGTLGDIGCFSLHPLKNFNVFGDGGLIVTNNKKYYLKLIKLRNLGLKNRSEAIIYGVNSRLDSIHASYAMQKLKFLKRFNLKMNRLGNLYNDKLKNYFTVPATGKDIFHIYHRYIVVCKRSRAKMIKYLSSKGIETKIHYPILLHRMKAYKDKFLIKEKFPVAEYLSKKILSLPLNNNLSTKQIFYIFKKISLYSHNI
jgi:dTDP-4-amino-4,6-dideoxygalactose transaminase